MCIIIDLDISSLNLTAPMLRFPRGDGGGSGGEGGPHSSYNEGDYPFVGKGRIGLSVCPRVCFLHNTT